MPYTYDVTFVGTDQHGDAMRAGPACDADARAGAAGRRAYNGRHRMLRTGDTYSYFQTGMTMTGTLTWGSIQRERSPEARATSTGSGFRWSPTAAAATATSASRAHEWRTINLDNGVDLSIWRQFDRTESQCAAAVHGCHHELADDADPEYADDIEVAVTSYVRWPEVDPHAGPAAAPRLGTCPTATA